jgi:hypothetical protein
VSQRQVAGAQLIKGAQDGERTAERVAAFDAYQTGDPAVTMCAFNFCRAHRSDRTLRNALMIVITIIVVLFRSLIFIARSRQYQALSFVIHRTKKARELIFVLLQSQ